MSEVSEETPAIEVHGLCNRFGAHVVHEGLDTWWCRAKVVSLVGGSGSGKTVLLNNLIMLTRPAAGSIRHPGAGRGGARTRGAYPAGSCA